MPNATVQLDEALHVDLKTCEGGFVKIKRMTYGQNVQRRALMKLSIASGGGRSRGNDFQGEMALASVSMTVFDFEHCIVDHNLEDETGRKLNLGTEQDLAKLDPRIGQEIELELAKLNDFEAEEGN